MPSCLKQLLMPCLIVLLASCETPDGGPCSYIEITGIAAEVLSVSDGYALLLVEGYGEVSLINPREPLKPGDKLSATVAEISEGTCVPFYIKHIEP